MLACYPVAFAGSNAWVIPVGIVYLELNEVDIGVIGEQLFKESGVSVERKAVVLYQTLCFKLLYKVPDVVFVVFLVVAALESVEQIIVKIACACSFKAGVELLLCALFIVARLPCAQLGAEGVAFSRVPFNESFSCDLLRLAVVIDKSGVKVSSACCHETIDHFAGLVNVYLSRGELGQTHKTESKLKNFFSEII